MMVANDRRQASRDRRQEPRAPLTAAVAAKRVTGAPPQDRGAGGTVSGAKLAQAANIGERGMTLRYAPDGSQYLPRTQIALAFQIPGDAEVIRVRGEVVFDRQDGCYRTAGVRFGRLLPRDARVIARFVGVELAE